MNLGIGLGVTNYLRVPTVPLDPDAAIAALFESGEEGAWYDPSDLTTLYQDAAGTTPVTGTGQPVGLMLDKSKGLTLGSEVVTNGTFDTDSNWDKGTHWTISGGVASSVNGSLRNLSQVCLTVGKTYKVSWDQTTSSGNIMVYVGLGFTTPAITGTGTKTAICKATTNTTLYFQAQNGFTGTIDNISVRELPGNHATQSTSTARPTLQTSGGLYYLDFDGVDDYMSLPSITTSQPFGLFVAAENQTLAIAGVISGGISGYLGVRYTTDAYWGTFDGAQRLFAITSVGSPDIVALTQDSGISYPRINGVDSSSYAANLTSQTWVIFGAFTSGSAQFDGRVYGSVIIEKSLSPAEVQSTESYLATKSGVTLP